MKLNVKTQKLGQNFLKNKKILKILASSLGDIHNKIVVEIGGGHGELTQFLNQAKKLIVYEIDKKLAEILKNKFPNAEIRNENFLKSDLKQFENNFYLIGNIPYSISGLIIRKIFSKSEHPKVAVLTFQKEYGEKILGKDGNNFLHSWINIWSQPQKILIIKKKYFFPQPKVDSMALKFEFYKNPLIDDIENYERFLKTLFKNPNKNIKNNFGKEIIDKNFSMRKPRSLKFEEVLQAFKMIKNNF